jgi:hypothetical protein
MEAPMQQQTAQPQPQPKQSKLNASNSNNELRARFMTAKSALGLKGLNVAAALAGHKMYSAAAAKNPNLQPNQVLNKISPNARSNYMKLTSAVPSDLLNSKTSTSQFRNTLMKLRQARGMTPLNNGIEFEDVEQISEALKDEPQPPPMLLLRRRGIRIFPDGRRVALYNNDQLGLIFTIPYSAPVGSSAANFDAIPGVQKEEVDLISETLDQVAKFAQQDNVTSNAKQFKFADGTKLKVSHGAAKAIHMVHGALNDENKKKFADMLNTPKGFEKAAHFALSRVNFTIGGK